MKYDLVIKNGTVIDGSGMPRYRADVGVIRGRIASIGRISDAADETIDAEGHVVTPDLSTVTPTWMPRFPGTLWALVPAGTA